MEKKKVHILVIDDNEDMLTMMAIILRGKGYKVTAREKFTHITEEIAAISPTLILIDKTLGWTDGLELCKKIRSIATMSEVKVLIFSAYSITAEACSAAGANGYFEKPFGMDKFINNIESWL